MVFRDFPDFLHRISLPVLADDALDIDVILDALQEVVALRLGERHAAAEPDAVDELWVKSCWSFVMVT